ncbi:MAG TPA: hypothetical protein VFE42_20600 [Chloroflexota bacterium]|nr:hypothetical protein [Chloroflexota bacterium]
MSAALALALMAGNSAVHASSTKAHNYRRLVAVYVHEYRPVARCAHLLPRLGSVLGAIALKKGLAPNDSQAAALRGALAVVVNACDGTVPAPHLAPAVAARAGDRNAYPFGVDLSYAVPLASRLYHDASRMESQMVQATHNVWLMLPNPYVAHDTYHVFFVATARAALTQALQAREAFLRDGQALAAQYGSAPFVR